MSKYYSRFIYFEINDLIRNYLIFVKKDSYFISLGHEFAAQSSYELIAQSINFDISDFRFKNSNKIGRIFKNARLDLSRKNSSPLEQEDMKLVTLNTPGGRRPLQVGPKKYDFKLSIHESLASKINFLETTPEFERRNSDEILYAFYSSDEEKKLFIDTTCFPDFFPNPGSFVSSNSILLNENNQYTSNTYFSSEQNKKRKQNHKPNLTFHWNLANECIDNNNTSSSSSSSISSTRTNATSLVINEKDEDTSSTYLSPEQNKKRKRVSESDLTFRWDLANEYFDNNNTSSSSSSSSSAIEQPIFLITHAKNQENLSSHHLSKQDKRSKLDLASPIKNNKKRANEKIATFSSKYAGEFLSFQDIYLINQSEINNPTLNNYNFNYSFIKLKKYLKYNEVSPRKKNTILNLENSSLSFYGTLPKLEETVTFIFAGRQDKALLPDYKTLGELQHLVVVVTEEESKALPGENYPDLDFLVIEKLSSASHGQYLKIGSIIARRLAAFLMCYLLKLTDCIFLDDNIASIPGKSNLSTPVTWAYITKNLQDSREREQTLFASLLRLSNKPRFKTVEDYCCKLFSFNFKQFASILKFQNADDVFVLSFPATFDKLCMEDYYMQMIIDFALAANQKIDVDDRTLLHIAPIEDMALIRDQTYRNLARNQTKDGLLETILQIKVEDFISNITHSFQQKLMSDALQHLQKNINIFFKRMKKRKDKFINGDYREIIFKNNQHAIGKKHSLLHIESDYNEDDLQDNHCYERNRLSNENIIIPSAWKENAPKIDFNNMLSYLEEIKGFPYPHQVNALTAISSGLNKGNSNVIKMCTGSGKTLVQILLANYILKQNPNAIIYIVVPTIQLVNQCYHDFQNSIVDLEKKEANYFRALDIIPIYSHAKAVSAHTLANNVILRQHTQVAIFCIDSFIKFLQNLTGTQPVQPAFISFDESHLYSNLINKIKALKYLIPAAHFSATPNNNDEPIYTFSLSESLDAKITVPLIIDKLPYSLNSKKNSKKYEKIVELVKYHCHPSGMALSEFKGIICAGSVKEAKKIAQALNQAHFPAVALHAKAEQRESIFENFCNQPLIAKAILVVVNMLGTGFSNTGVTWVIVCKDQRLRSSAITQYVGRALRICEQYPDKIAYVIVDAEVKLHEFTSLADRQALQKAAPAYFKNNCQFIYLALEKAIEEQADFEKYFFYFTAEVAKNYSLMKHLTLLLVALKNKNNSWVQGIIKFNQSLLLNVTIAPEHGNVMHSFLSKTVELLRNKSNTDEKTRMLFSPEQFISLWDNIRSHNPNLYNDLIKENYGKSIDFVNLFTTSGKFYQIPSVNCNQLLNNNQTIQSQRFFNSSNLLLRNSSTEQETSQILTVGRQLQTL